VRLFSRRGQTMVTEINTWQMDAIWPTIEMAEGYQPLKRSRSQ
jgi:hypothetical protein